MDPNELYAMFKEWNPDLVEFIADYKPWGSHSLCIWLNNGMTYKVKHYNAGFIMQAVSAEDIKRKYGENP